MNAVSNSTGKYLLMHAEIETEGARVPKETFDAAVERMIRDPKVGPANTVADIAQICGWLSTTQREVCAHVRCINGKPVLYFVREAPPQGLDALLRPGSDVPLLRRQAD